MSIWVQNVLYLIGGGIVGAAISFFVTKSKFEKQLKDSINTLTNNKNKDISNKVNSIIENAQTKEVVESLRPDVIRFSENNHISAIVRYLQRPELCR